jgi:ubiquitin C-terminal hydrolase
MMTAYIIRKISEDRIAVHYIGYSFRYEMEVETETIFMDEQEVVEALKNSRGKISVSRNSLTFKGIQNIGNTCFINSIIECLIASPIL